MNLKKAAEMRAKREGDGGEKTPRIRTNDGSRLDPKPSQKFAGALFGQQGFYRRHPAFAAMLSKNNF